MQATQTDSIPFCKMHGLGNDFVVIDSRQSSPLASSALARVLSDRRRGVGFDQLAEIRDSNAYDARLVFFNADGSSSAACGNATRCVARMLMDESGAQRLVLETGRGPLECVKAEDGLTSVNMGVPLFEWQQVPLVKDLDTISLPIEGNPSALSMGNPHCVFFVENAETVLVDELGPEMERHPLFPERTNVEFVTVQSKNSIRMRIWERGTGITPASGSGSCAAAVASARRSLTGRKVTVDVDGGRLEIDWRSDGVWMTGQTAYVFDGTISRDFATGP